MPEELIVLSDTDQRVKFTDFFPGSSGPFGEELAGKWYDYPQAKEMLKKHREDKMRLNEPGHGPFGAIGMQRFNKYSYT